MPSQIIHTLAGIDALTLSGITIPASCLSAFNLGVQGPDIFSHNRRTKPFALAYSRLLHRHDYGRFCFSIARILLEKPSPLLASWFYGFVTHQAIDRVFHPYIINRSFVSASTGIAGVSPAHFHAFFERILDVRFLEDVKFQQLHSFDTGEPFFLSVPDIGIISESIAFALCETFPLETEADSEILARVENAFHDAIYFYEITNPVVTDMNGVSGCLGIQRFIELGVGGASLLYPEDAYPEIDWLNGTHTPWSHPVSGELSFSSVQDLYSEALSCAVSAITLVSSILSGRNSPELLEIEIGNDCLSVSGSDGKIGVVTHYEPINLAPLLLDQAGKRKAWLSRAIG